LPKIYLIGNKIDLPYHEVSTEESEKLAESLGNQYFEISCKYNINIYEVMTRMIIESILEKRINSELKYYLRSILYHSNYNNNSFKNILNKYKNYWFSKNNTQFQIPIMLISLKK